MSAVAASAAVLDHPLPGLVDNSVDEPREGIPGQRSEAQLLLSGQGLPEVRLAVVADREQDIVWTRSRRAEPRAWLVGLEWLVAAGLHEDACPTTLVIARDLAARMDYRRGIVLYDLEGTARRTDTSPATVKRHVRVMRELGALVWLVHGSKRNIAAPGEPYMATGTIYGAVIPPVFDEAMGHRLTGTGYEGRVCGVTEAGRERAIAASAARSKDRHDRARLSPSAARRGSRVPASRGSHPVDTRGVDKSCSAGREPHSPGRYHQSPEADVESGSKNTSRKRASRSTTWPVPEKSSSNSGGPRRTARQVQRGIWTTQQVRARVPWTQRVRLRRLEFVLRPLTDQGMDADSIVVVLHSWMLTWRPARPAEYIRVQLAKQASVEHQVAAYEAAEGWDEREASGALAASRPDLVQDVLAGLAEGLATYSARQAEQGLDDLTDHADAETAMAAFLGTTSSMAGARHE
ncbi:cell wall protein [Streptomyces sp. NPDC008125]|uniref:cell wall protein n=1 Tax=Streptomyces sp. NPDC008125 TaxID=3364811 RepID=UPI0036E288C4